MMEKKRGKIRVTYFVFLVMLLLFLPCCGRKESASEGQDLAGLKWEETEENRYAEHFTIDHYSGGYRRIRIEDQSILLIPEGKDVPAELPEGTIVLKQPVSRIYMASSSAMSFFEEMDRLDRVSFTSTKASDWTDERIRKEVYEDRITYVGKYSTPDYEWLLSEGADLAVENTMLLHAPDAREKLEQMGIPVIIERSSYESHPMGRLEWIRVYGCILGCEEQADEIFRARDQEFQAILQTVKENAGKVGYFCFSPNGYVNVQSSSGYFAEMIRLAGGEYVFQSEDLPASDGNSSSLHLSHESFYSMAAGADVLIYNGSIYGAPESMEQLLRDEPLMADLPAVKNGRVYYTENNLFQEPTRVTALIRDLQKILAEDKDPETEYLLPLK